MRSAFLALLISCSPADPMAARAEHAALACYDNGTLVYASEMTATELGVRQTEYEHAAEKHRNEREVYVAAMRRSKGENQTAAEKKICEYVRGLRSRSKTAPKYGESCSPVAGTGEVVQPLPDEPRSPSPYETAKGWAFQDLNGKFESNTATCVVRGKK